MAAVSNGCTTFDLIVVVRPKDNIAIDAFNGLHGSLATGLEGCPWFSASDEEHGVGLYFPQVTTTARNNAVALRNVYPNLQMFLIPTSRYAEVVNDDTSELSYTLARLTAADELEPVAAEAETQPDAKS